MPHERAPVSPYQLGFSGQLLLRGAIPHLKHSTHVTIVTHGLIAGVILLFEWRYDSAG